MLKFKNKLQYSHLIWSRLIESTTHCNQIFLAVSYLNSRYTKTINYAWCFHLATVITFMIAQSDRPLYINLKRSRGNYKVKFTTQLKHLVNIFFRIEVLGWRCESWDTKSFRKKWWVRKQRKVLFWKKWRKCWILETLISSFNFL